MTYGFRRRSRPLAGLMACIRGFRPIPEAGRWPAAAQCAAPQSVLRARVLGILVLECALPEDVLCGGMRGDVCSCVAPDASAEAFL